MIERHSGRLLRPNCEIFYESTGSGPVLLFAHGLSGNHMSWWQQVAHFQDRFRCVTFCHRGFGRSSYVAGGPDPVDYADDLEALVSHLEISKVRLIAQSMGGWGAIEYALRQPSALASLVLSATTGTVDINQLPSRHLDQIETWSAISDTARTTMLKEGVHPAAGRRMAAEQPALHLLYRQIDELNTGIDKDVIRARLVSLQRRAPTDLRRIEKPVLLVINSEDVVIAPAAMEGIAALVPAFKVEHIEDAGHSGYFERASTFNRCLTEFFC